MLRRLAPVAMLAVLSPFVAEFLLADQYLIGPVGFQQFGTLLFFVPLYGFGAITIREAARRAGLGWPTIVLSALAFGVLEEGLLTQSLFDPNYANAHLLDSGFIPALGIAGPWTVYVLVLHTVWSICAPIAVVEGRFGREPWLGAPGRWVSIALYVLGCVLTFAVSYSAGAHFLAPLPSLLAVVIIAGLLVAAAFLFGTPERVRSGRMLPSFMLGLIASGAFQGVRLVSSSLSAPVVTLLLLAIPALAAYAIRRLPVNAFGLGAGAVLTYCWLGLLSAGDYGAAAIAEQAVLVALTVAGLAVSARRRTVLR